MLNIAKYKRNPVVHYPEREWPDKEIEKAPIWCSVDLRDGNQALVEPMVVEEKIEFFNMLVKLGFKEIEIGFPAASQIEYDFLRQLVERRLIPDDVRVQVLVQCREHLIKRTFEAIQGIKKVVVHIYNSTSTLQRDVVFHKNMEEIKQIAIEGTELVKKYAKDYDGDLMLEYSPESFTGTELEYALEVCTAVQDTWGEATPEKPIIFNLPSTVEMNTPNVYADQIEWMHKHFKNRESIILSVHPHNDRGTGVAATELALLAGADRVEGTLFGNGERTGNVDILNIAYNMFSQGIDPKLDIENVREIAEVYERCTKMTIDPRHPYAGKLVFTAFSGSHQDAINKGLQALHERNSQYWEVPYLPIDPSDIGRQYEPIVRINSQSGKGGVGFIMEQNYGIDMPKKMREDFSYFVKEVSDHKHQELKPAEIYDVFQKNYLNADTPLKVEDFSLKKKGDKWVGKVLVRANDEEVVLEGAGNGQLNAVSNAVCKAYGIEFSNLVYSEHDLDRDSDSRGIAYFGLTDKDGHTTWGAGVDTDTITASIFAFMTAINRMDGMAQRVKFRALKSTPDTITAFKATSGQH